MGGMLPAIVGPLIVAEPLGSELLDGRKEQIKDEINNYLLICKYVLSRLLLNIGREKWIQAATTNVFS